MFITALALAVQSAPAPAAALSIEQQTAVRCAAAFAMTARAQARGEADALSLPPMAERGREFFVRVAAQLMDETGMDRQQVSAVLAAQAAAVAGSGETVAVARSCLPFMEAAAI